MQRYLTPHRVFAAVVVVALVAAAPVLWARLRAERASGVVELAIDLDETEELALSWGVPLPDVLTSLARAGLTTVAVEDMTLERLARLGHIALFDGGGLQAFLGTHERPHPLLAAAAARGDVRPGSTYAFATDEETSSFLKTTAPRAFGEHRVRAFPEGPAVLVEVAGVREDVALTGLGLWEGDLQAARAAHLTIMARPANVGRLDAAAVREVLAALDGYPVNVVCFTGYQALGYPTALAEAAAEFARRGWLLGMVEAPVQRGFITQDGTADLAARLDYRVARVYAISRKELDKISVADALDRWLRGTKERNIRVVYLRPLLAGEAKGWELEATRRYVERVAGELGRAGFTLGRAVAYPPLAVRLWYAFPMACGVIAAGLLLLLLIWPSRLRSWVAWGLFAGGASLWLGLALVFSASLARLGAALAASIIFPSLGVLWAAARYGLMPAGGAAAPGAGSPGGGRVGRARAWLAGVGAVLEATAITIAGAALIGALLGDIRYLLEIDYFRGVKMSYVLPLGLIAFGYLRATAGDGAGAPDASGPGAGRAEPGWRGLARRAAGLLARRLTAWELGLLLVLAFGAVLYVGRAGHESGIPVMGLEVKLRALLEHTLVARPRLKEVLIGHPALMVAAFLAARSDRSYVALLLLAAGVGQVSVINSFEHLRTPLVISLLRSGNGLVVGLLAGAVAAVVAGWLLHLARASKAAVRSGAVDGGGGGR